MAIHAEVWYVNKCVAKKEKLIGFHTDPLFAVLAFIVNIVVECFATDVTNVAILRSRLAHAMMNDSMS